MKSRHGIFYLRLTQNGKEKRKSLRTRDPVAARAAAYALGARLSLFDPEIVALATKLKIEQRAQERLKALKDSADEEAYFQLLLQKNPHIKQPPQQQTEPVIAPSITIEAAIEKYQAARIDNTKAGTKRTWKSSYNKLKAAFPRREVRSISPEEMTHLIVNPPGGKSPETISKDVDTWWRVFDWLRLHKLCGDNPVIKPSFKSNQSKLLSQEYSQPRIPFNSDDIKTLFSKEHLDSLKRPEDPWIQLIGLATGARLESISRLKVQDVSDTTIRLVAKYDKESVERVIPIHPLLIKAGLHIYVKEIGDKFGQGSYLFTEMTEVDDRRSHAYSLRFGRQTEALGLQKGKVFHSFRGTLISTLDKANANGRARRLYVGHKVGEKLDVDELNYNKSQYTTEELAAAIFPYIDWQIEDWKYTPQSALQQIAVLTARREKAALQTDRKEKKVKIDKKELARRQAIQMSHAQIKSNTTK